jgi:hypothetical protein
LCVTAFAGALYLILNRLFLFPTIDHLQKENPFFSDDNHLHGLPEQEASLR